MGQAAEAVLGQCPRRVICCQSNGKSPRVRVLPAPGTWRLRRWACHGLFVNTFRKGRAGPGRASALLEQPELGKQSRSALLPLPMETSAGATAGMAHLGEAAVQA